MRLKDTKESEIYERKRTRSSLDVKVSNGETLTRPPKSKKQANPHYDFSDLEGMSEEEILQALYDNPELAAAAAASAAAENTDGKSYGKPKSIPKTSRTVSEYPDHLRAMMDEGVPIKQWIILLVLLGAGLYQLRKVLVVGSRNNVKHKKLEKGSKAEKPSRKGGKQKGKRKASSSSSFVKARSSAPVVVKSAPRVAVSLVEEVPVVAAAPKKANKNKKKARNRQKNKPPAIAVETKKEETDALSHESPDSISTDGSSSTTGVAQHEEQAAISPMSNKVESVIVEAIDENDGWQTVGAPVVETKAANKTVAKQAPVAANAPAQVPDVIEESKPEEVTVEPTNGKEVAAPDEQANKANKKKKGKKKAALEESSGDTATDDEALAKQLQLQEEKIAEHEATKAQEDDVWEEVTIKKKKRP